MVETSPPIRTSTCSIKHILSPYSSWQAWGRRRTQVTLISVRLRKKPSALLAGQTLPERLRKWPREPSRRLVSQVDQRPAAATGGIWGPGPSEPDQYDASSPSRSCAAQGRLEISSASRHLLELWQLFAATVIPRRITDAPVLPHGPRNSGWCVLHAVEILLRRKFCDSQPSNACGRWSLLVPFRARRSR